MERIRIVKGSKLHGKKVKHGFRRTVDEMVAVAEMVKIVFGEGEVVEWPDFDEPPYTPGTFDIVTNAQLTPDILEYFVSVIDRVKKKW